MKNDERQTYSAAIEFLYSLQQFGANFGLDHTFRLAALVGNPQNKLRFIHVAGTNGKGSTCAMLESIYRAAGLRVGLFTSPHLVSFRERIQVNRQLISEADVVRLVDELRTRWERRAPARPVEKCHQLAEQVLGAPAAAQEIQPTLFEFVTVMALKYFAEQKCDLVIWETGLGGRLDATNIVSPLASVITNITFDHTQWLGDTLEKIAAEKAGIIKPGVPVVTAADQPEVLAVIGNVAHKNCAALTKVNPESRIQNPESLLGEHQKLNAALAVATVEALQRLIPISHETIRVGLAGVNWPGRLQLVQTADGQKILLDGAHNLAGAEMLCAAMEQNFPGARPLLIFGALADKNWPDICRVLAPLAAKVFTVPVASERTASPDEVSKVFRAANPVVSAVAHESLAAALNASHDAPMVLVTGSLYLVGEALAQLGCSPAGRDERGLNEWSASKIRR